MDVVFGCCPKKLFGKVLELGAGDGFASTIFEKYTEQLTCTEINPERLINTDRGNITFKTCDEEKVSFFWHNLFCREYTVFQKTLLQS
jgi:protein-L-isoaspartate O-methyltransferase